MQSTRDNDLLLKRSSLENYDNSCEDIYLLTDREVALIITCIRYADWEARWFDRDADFELVETLKRKLLMLCVSDLVKSNLLIVAALSGREIDLSNDTEIINLLNSNQNFSEDGVVPAIDRLVAAIQPEEEPDYTDELLTIAGILGAAI